MFRRASVQAAIVAAMLGGAAVVGHAAESILKLALQLADMPKTAVRSALSAPRLMETEWLAPFGVREVQAAQYLYEWPVDATSKTSSDSIPRLWQLQGKVYRAPDQSGANRLFAMGKASGGGLLSDRHFRGRNVRDVSLPSYGDEQFVRVATDSDGSVVGLLFVRRGTVVWEMLIQSTPTVNPTEAQVVEVLQKYGAMQKARVDASGNRP